MKQHFIDNASVPGSSGERIPVIDPSTGQEFDSIARGNAADIDLAVQAARRAYEAPGAASAPPNAAGSCLRSRSRCWSTATS